MTGLVVEFLPALLDPDLPVPPGLQDGQGRPAGRRFNVYRNNVTASLIAALETGFPAIHSLLGAQNFTALARAFAQANPPQSRLMMHDGAGFPEVLETRPQLAHLGYLGDVARLELALRHAYHAVDAAPLDPAILANLPPEALPETCVTLAPATRLVPSPWPIVAIRDFALTPGRPQPPAVAQDALVTRPGFDPQAHPLPPGGAAFLQALMQGDTLARAQEAGLTAAPGFDPAPVLALLIAGQAITGIA